MNKTLHTFFESSLLERYLVGDTSHAETLEVESFIEKYPEVRSKFDALQENLEIISKFNAVEPKENILNDVIAILDEKPVRPLYSSDISKVTPWYSIAASVAAVLFGALSLFLFTQNRALLEKNTLANDEINELRYEAADVNSKFAEISRRYNMLVNPETNKYTMRGNNRAKNLKTVAYINHEDKLAMIDVVSLPELSKEQDYQLWIQLQDDMINVGVLDPSARNLMPVQYIDNAISYQITVGPKGGTHTVSAETSVANISIKNDNE